MGGLVASSAANKDTLESIIYACKYISINNAYAELIIARFIHQQLPAVKCEIVSMATAAET